MAAAKWDEEGHSEDDDDDDNDDDNGDDADLISYRQ